MCRQISSLLGKDGADKILGNPDDLNQFFYVQSYMNRTDLGIAREVAANGKAMLGSTRYVR